MKLKISGGDIVNPAGEQFGKLDILIEDGKISAIGKDVGDAERVIDAAGLTVFPGFIDLHCHLREPGQEYKEDIMSGTKAAVKGGYTAVCCMPNTKPVMDTAAVVALVNDRARRAPAKVYPVGAASVGLSGKELTEMGEMSSLGCVAFSDDGHPIESGAMMRRAMMYAQTYGKMIMAHEEDLSIKGEGIMNEGYQSTVLGMPGISRVAEEAMIARDLLLAQTYGLKLHIQHVSTAGGIELIRAAKAKGTRVTCESAPHYFSADDSMCAGFDANTKVNPPLREKGDVKAVKAGLLDGTIDAIATDHAPHHKDEKKIEFALAASGISGFETAFSLAVTNLTDDADKLAELFSVNPARIIEKKSGVIENGSFADITIADMSKQYTFTEQSIISKGKNSPFIGQKLKGVVTHTIVDGELVYEAN
ncbi:MAG: dihydroorotase [Clostridia bacterium]|jgi:dihydroorotase|nr:dihydroorotase [Clostridia bacterium]